MKPAALTSSLFLLATKASALRSVVRSSDVSISLPAPSSIPSYNVVQDNFAGISLEFNVLDYLIGPDPDHIPTPMKNYISNLRSRISSDFRLRVGGNSLDGSYYDPNASQMINFNLNSTANGIKNIPVTFGPQVLTTLTKLAQEVGGIYHLLGLSLMHPDNETNVVNFAKAAQSALGSTLDAFLDGNEPDLYEEDGKRHANYTTTDYSTELNLSAQDLKNGGVNTLLGSPSICCSHPNWGLADVLTQTLKSPIAAQLKYATVQHYPQQACDSYGSSRWDISYFTNHSNVQALMQFQGDGVLMARDAGKQVIMDETNSASCGGAPGRSDTFAAAMWTVDYELGLAAANYSAVYMHTREPGISYDLFQYPTPSDETKAPTSADESAEISGWTTGPQYYSLLLLSEAFSNLGTKVNGSVVVDLNLPNPTAVAGYALYDANNLHGSPRALVLLNFANGTDSTTFTIPSGLASASDMSSVRIMTAPTLNEKSANKITYAGQNVDGTGSITGSLNETKLKCSGGCNVVVPGPGVALVVLNSSGAKQTTGGKGHASALLAPGVTGWMSWPAVVGTALLAWSF